MKHLFIVLGLFCISIFIQSCSKSCEGVTCEYDGVCDNGDCVCNDLTANYLIGSWEIVSTNSSAGTFNVNKTFTDSFGNVVPWNLDSSTNTITLSSNSTITVKEDGFTCNQMNVTIVNSLGTNDWTLVRN